MQAYSSKDQLSETRACFPFLVPLGILGPSGATVGKMARAGIGPPTESVPRLGSLPTNCSKIIKKLPNLSEPYLFTHQMG